MRLAAPYCHTYDRHQTYPEWPLTLNRIVRTAHLAVNCPNHVGRFRDYAFPQWWRLFWGGRQEFLKKFGVHPNHDEREWQKQEFLRVVTETEAHAP